MAMSLDENITLAEQVMKQQNLLILVLPVEGITCEYFTRCRARYDGPHQYHYDEQNEDYAPAHQPTC